GGVVLVEQQQVVRAGAHVRLELLHVGVHAAEGVAEVLAHEHFAARRHLEGLAAQRDYVVGGAGGSAGGAAGGAAAGGAAVGAAARRPAARGSAVGVTAVGRAGISAASGER